MVIRSSHPPRAQQVCSAFFDAPRCNWVAASHSLSACALTFRWTGIGKEIRVHIRDHMCTNILNPLFLLLFIYLSYINAIRASTYMYNTCIYLCITYVCNGNVCVCLCKYVKHYDTIIIRLCCFPKTEFDLVPPEVHLLQYPVPPQPLRNAQPLRTHG